jgi:thiol:disulfide interchange protein DsbA
MRVFDAIHKQGQQLLTDQAVVDWAVKQGIDKAKFEQIYQSFGIDTKVQRAAAMGRAYGVQFTPSLAVNGKYWTGPSMVISPNGGPDIPRFFEVVDGLVARERGKPAAAGGTKKKS